MFSEVKDSFDVTRVSGKAGYLLIYYLSINRKRITQLLNYVLVNFLCMFYINLSIKCEQESGDNEFRKMRRERKHCYCVARFYRRDNFSLFHLKNE